MPSEPITAVPKQLVEGNYSGQDLAYRRAITPWWRGARAWGILGVMVLCWLGLMQSRNITRPWVNFVDYNGAVWSQAAHNILRAGMVSTEGASTGFYFGPLPIPAKGYYLHHPPVLHLLLTFIFWMVGEHEWAARLLPITCSLLSGLFLWLLVRNCAGVRVATFSLAVFASLPMELRYGPMVNFEPLVLMLMLGGLLSLRYWHVSGEPLWKFAALGSCLLGMWVDWAMYLFVIVLCCHWLIRRDRATARLAWILMGFMLVSVALYFLRIRFLRPDAWDSLVETLLRRVSSKGSIHFTEIQWAHQIGSTLATHFLPSIWAAPFMGAVYLFRKRASEEGLRWLGWGCLAIFAMDALFVGVFQNDSFIHAYIAFYLSAPLAIAGGLGHDRFTSWLQDRFVACSVPRIFATAMGCLLMVLTGYAGKVQADRLNRQFLVLDFKQTEPPDLIPKLGKVIRENFAPNTRVLCNFLPVYGPQLGYYAQRNLLNDVQEPRSWQGFIQSPRGGDIGGIVWLNSEQAREIVKALPAGTKRYLRVDNLSFCIWNPPPSRVQKGAKTAQLNATPVFSSPNQSPDPAPTL